VVVSGRIQAVDSERTSLVYGMNPAGRRDGTTRASVKWASKRVPKPAGAAVERQL